MKQSLLLLPIMALLMILASCDVLKDIATKTVEGQVACVPATGIHYNKSYELVRAKKFEEDRESSAMRETKHLKCMTTSQIKKMAALMKFENTRLDYAKFAYHHCSDPDNYLKMNEIFKFESSKEELEKYVR